MAAALETARAEEAADPVGRKGLSDKVLRVKLAIDHVLLINDPLLRQHAVSAGKPFPGAPDFPTAVREWIAACERFNVKAYCETTSEATFTTYKKALLERSQK